MTTHIIPVAHLRLKRVHEFPRPRMGCAFSSTGFGREA